MNIHDHYTAIQVKLNAMAWYTTAKYPNNMQLLTVIVHAGIY